MLTITTPERRFELSRAVNQLCEASLRGDTSDVLQSLVDVAGPAVRADRASIYDIQLPAERAIGLYEWLRPDVEITPTKGTYPLDVFGPVPREIARTWAPFESSCDDVPPLLAPGRGHRPAIDTMRIRRLLCHPIRRRDDGYFLLSFDQVFENEPWTPEERGFVKIAAAHIDLALMKLELVRQRERAEAELRTSERRFRQFYDSTPSMFFTVDRDGVVRGMNHYATHHLGYNEAELVGRGVLEIVHPNDRAGVQHHFDACFDDPGMVSELSFRKICKDGTTVWVKETMRVADGPDGVTAFIVCDDITEARAHEEAARQAENKAHDRDEFMAMLGHELRNPLTPIVTALDILRRRGHADDELELIDRQVSHLRRLVDDLLDVSRITRGKVELNLEAVEMAVVAAQAVEVARPLFHGKRQSLHVDVASRGLRVIGDVTRLVQAFANLLTNAAKFSGEGQRIFFAAERSGDRVRVEVRDDGEGIDPGMLDRVFDLFVQRIQSADRAQSGLGLGLTIVRNLITLHGGTVRASSEGRGKGTVVTVDLPLATDIDVSGERSASGTAELTPRVAAARKILVVDDNDDVRTSLCRLLDLCGYHAIGARDAATALSAAQELNPRVVLVDIGLPGMDGYELARQLRRAQPNGPQLVAITGYGQPSDRARSRDAGFVAHLVKPIDIDKLLPLLDPLT